MVETLFAAVSFGFLGSLHCVGMCGGLVGALSMSHQKSWGAGLWLYQLGRITAYAILGWIVAQIGIGLEYVGGDKWQTMATIAVGLVMVAYGLNLTGIIPDPFSRFTVIVMKLLNFRKHTGTMSGAPALTSWLAMGFINGLLPCGLVYAALAMALTSEVAVRGAYLMALFGIGTVPAMTLAPTVMRLVAPKLRGNLLRATGFMMIFYGVFTSLRGSGIMHFIHKHRQDNQIEILKEKCSVNEFHFTDKANKKN